MTFEPEREPGAEETDLSWIPEKFRADPPQLARSYGELEAKLTQTSQLLREQQEQFEAFLASEEQSQQVAAEPRQRQSRGRQLETMKLLAEQAAEHGARQVIRSVSTGKTPAPKDPAVLSRVTSEILAQRDPRWHEVDVDLLAQVVAERPSLISNLDDLDSVVSGLETAGELARGRQLEGQMQTWARVEAMREMKLQAQTVSGATGRGEPMSDDEEFFARLQAAHNQSYSASRANS